ncbi:MAG: hypothetical protein V2A58_02005 [Planctomycetota bacterium]
MVHILLLRCANPSPYFSMTGPVTWYRYNFEILPPGLIGEDVPGVYVFAGQNQSGVWYPVYIGQTESLAERLAIHKRWPEAAKLGASHVHILRVPLAKDRDRIEMELIGLFQPPLNVLLR